MTTPRFNQAVPPAISDNNTTVAPNRLPRDSWGVFERTELTAIKISGIEVAKPRRIKPVRNCDIPIWCPRRVVAEPPVTSVPRSDSQDQQPGGQLADAATTPAAEPAPMPATVNPETAGGEIDYGTSGTTAPVSMVTEELAQQSQKEEKKGGGALWMIIGILIGLGAGRAC